MIQGELEAQQGWGWWVVWEEEWVQVGGVAEHGTAGATFYIKRSNLAQSRVKYTAACPVLNFLTETKKAEMLLQGILARRDFPQL